MDVSTMGTWHPASTLKALQEVFPAQRSAEGRAKRIRIKQGRPGAPPVAFQVVLLGNVEEPTGAATSRKGTTWLATKWSHEDGTEFFLHFSLADEHAVVVEKDEARRNDLIRLFTSLVVRR
jgi:hypothetical protein